jgi:ATP-dependent Clp protease ATP-binding subunit ClpA
LPVSIRTRCSAPWKRNRSPPKCPHFRSLEQALHRALALASERSHEYATLEHLLLALIDDRDAAAVMRACGVDLEQLRDNLENYVDRAGQPGHRRRARTPSPLPVSSG